jgi:hypothetical protein
MFSKVNVVERRSVFKVNVVKVQGCFAGNQGKTPADMVQSFRSFCSDGIIRQGVLLFQFVS